MKPNQKRDAWRVPSDPARHPSPVTRHSERGIALVISLIMLSVTLIMAVAFLAVARRERNAATTSTDTALARLATDAALAAAQAEIMANVLTAASNAYNFDLLVSTNILATDPYDPLNVGKFSPRAPVFVPTNGGLDFRFYLDLNRNGRDEPNGWVAEVDGTGATNGNTVWVTGDPEWIGVLERPDADPAKNNKFIARYAFFAQPVGNALDLNYIHNQAKSGPLNPTMPVAFDGYLRNQGVGSWELNLAAFLGDLNTNTWLPVMPPANGYYAYNQPANANVGIAFNDALSLLSYRYGYNYGSLAPANNYFSPTNLANYPYNIDVYSDGPVQSAVNFSATPPGDNLNNAWAGADNPNRFFALPSELFNPTNTSVPFTNRLTTAGKGLSTYDRYTFYRLLSQLGTDSTADDNRMNLNFDNLDAGGTVLPGAETNLIAWTPLRFFTNAANRLLTNSTTAWLKADAANYAQAFQTNNAFGVASIPVYVNGQFVYSPALNRLLQLAANIYDAANSSPWPSVFRPMFTRLGNNVFITGYTYVNSVSGTNDIAFSTPFDAATIAVVGGTNILENVYGVPWIIGAKKGLPNFNQFYLLSSVQVTRKLQITKPYFGAQPDLFRTNQMYLFSISNSLGCSFWNSYTNNYTNGPISIVARDIVTMTLTNDEPGFVPPIFTNYPAINAITTLASWPRTLWQGDAPSTVLDPANGSFLTFNTTVTLLKSPSIYRYGGYVSPGGVVWPPAFDQFNNDYQTNVYTPQLPQFGLQTTNRLQVFILADGHVIDYAHFAGPEGGLNINTNLADPNSSYSLDQPYMWSTNGGSPSAGVLNQIYVSQVGGPPPPNAGGKWESPGNLPAGVPATKEAEKAAFTGFLNYNRIQYGVFVFNGKRYVNTNLAVQVPYTPTRTVYNYTTWQANDPLVHYLASDLEYYNPGQTGTQTTDDPINGLPPVSVAVTDVNKRYSPWGLAYPYPNANNSLDATWLMPLKDPLVWRSDDWNFPANFYPGVGWLGRVHRGTPWQTVYLKASDILSANNGPNSWARWTGNNTFDAANTAPLADAALFDLFTTSPNLNATHGTLSVNQSGLAAWSAVFSGIVALTNTTAAPAVGVVPTVGSSFVNPAGLAGANSPLGNIVNNINTTRSSFKNADGVTGSFERISDVLRAPLLTEQSPFLNWNGTAQQRYDIRDELYEWLPQQIMGLLRVPSTPRYVIYCYGQTLHPAVGGLVTSGGANFGMITNYQVVAESAARAVVRVDKHVSGSGTNYTTVVESYNVLPP